MPRIDGPFGQWQVLPHLAANHGWTKGTVASSGGVKSNDGGESLWDEAVKAEGWANKRTLTPSELKKVDTEMLAIERANPQLAKYGPEKSFDFIYPGEPLWLPPSKVPPKKITSTPGWKEGTTLSRDRSVSLGNGFSLHLGHNGILYLDKAGSKNPIWTSDTFGLEGSTIISLPLLLPYPQGIVRAEIDNGEIYFENESGKILLKIPIDHIPHLAFNKETGKLTATS